MATLHVLKVFIGEGGTGGTPWACSSKATNCHRKGASTSLRT